MSAPAARVLVTRPADQSAGVATLLRDAGYEPVVAATVAVEPLADLTALDTALRELCGYRWVILASANAAQVFASRVAAMQLDCHPATTTALLTGPAGARALEAAGVRVDRIVSPFSASAVLDALAAEPMDGARVLLPRAKGGREELSAALRARGAVVDDVTVYRTVPVRESDSLVAALRRGVVAVTFFSPSAVGGFVAAVGSGGLNVERALEGVVVACLGATTAGAARAHGLRVDVVPEDTSAAALADALAGALAQAARREVAWSA